MVYEHTTMGVQGVPDKIMNSQVAKGWEIWQVLQGLTDETGHHRPLGVTLFMRRERQEPKDGE